jgi:hypothetical protein
VILLLEAPNYCLYTHSSVLGCEMRQLSAPIMSRSCFAPFPVCIYKFSSHYLNNIMFYRQQFGASSERITLYKMLGVITQKNWKVNLRVREFVKTLIVSVWLKSSIFALLCLIRATAYLRGTLRYEDGTMVEWQWEWRNYSNSEKFCCDPIFPLQRAHEFSREWTEVSLVRNPFLTLSLLM